MYFKHELPALARIGFIVFSKEGNMLSRCALQHIDYCYLVILRTSHDPGKITPCALPRRDPTRIIFFTGTRIAHSYHSVMRFSLDSTLPGSRDDDCLSKVLRENLTAIFLGDTPGLLEPDRTDLLLSLTAPGS